MDESSFTGEAEPCNKTEGVLLEAGDITTLSNVVFMGTLVRYGKGKVSPGITDLFLSWALITDYVGVGMERKENVNDRGWIRLDIGNSYL